MSGDEILILFVSAVASLLGWGLWHWRLLVRNTLGRRRLTRLVLLAALPLAMALLWTILRLWSADDVRTSGTYLFFYMTLGLGWLCLASAALPLLGLFPLVDALDNGNPAATLVTPAAYLGLMLCFAGGNIGNGPGWWVVVFSAGLSTGTMILCWALLNGLARTHEAIGVERSLPDAARLACLLLAWGAILGRGVAGDWHSAVLTVADFVRLAWPAPLLALAECSVSRLISPQFQGSTAPRGVLGSMPGLIYLCVAGLVIYWAGPW